MIDLNDKPTPNETSAGVAAPIAREAIAAPTALNRRALRVRYPPTPSLTPLESLYASSFASKTPTLFASRAFGPSPRRGGQASALTARPSPNANARPAGQNFGRLYPQDASSTDHLRKGRPVKIITMADQDRREKPEGLSLSGILSRIAVVGWTTAAIVIAPAQVQAESTYADPIERTAGVCAEDGGEWDGAQCRYPNRNDEDDQPHSANKSAGGSGLGTLLVLGTAGVLICIVTDCAE